MNMKVFFAVFLAILAIPVLAQDTNAGAANPAAGGKDEDRAPAVPGDHFTNSVGMELIKAGGFWAGKYEVTQKQYQKVTGANPSAFSGDDRPVDSVSWNDAMDFCQKLTAADLKDKFIPEGYFYTLPTEGEWELLADEATLADAVTSQNSPRDGTAPVGSLGPNSLGLYDTRGNVMEFCLGDPDKPYRVLRGGSWSDNIEINLRKEFRFYCTPDDRKNTFGFRCVLKQK